VLVNERAGHSEYAKHTLIPASVTRSNSSAIQTCTMKQMAVIVPATQSNRRGTDAGFQEGAGVIVCHVFEDVCLVLVLSEADRK
jgi:hypothetical protein